MRLVRSRRKREGIYIRVLMIVKSGERRKKGDGDGDGDDCCWTLERKKERGGGVPFIGPEAGKTGDKL